MMHIRTWIFVLGLMIGMLVSNAAAQGQKLYPVDEAAKDSSFKVFRDRLLAAARKKDKQFILSILDPKIQSSFGGDSGISDFKKMWKFDEPGSLFWNEMTTVLKLGGSFETIEGHKEFVAPYVSSKWPENPKLDAFEYVAVIGTDVRLRAEPGIASRVVASLSYDIVKLVNTTPSSSTNHKDGFNWIKIMTIDGKQGFVADKFVRSPIAYRAYFRKIKGNWILTVFIAGD